MNVLSGSMAYINELERKLEFKQLSDTKIKESNENLKINNSDKFALINGLVYKKEDDGLKFVVPEAMESSVLRAHHDNITHCETEKTIQGIGSNYWFTGMHKKVKDYVDNCVTYWPIICQINSKQKHNFFPFRVLL